MICKMYIECTALSSRAAALQLLIMDKFYKMLTKENGCIC